MLFWRNPFYLFEISCNDDRDTIIRKINAKQTDKNKNTCAYARSLLLSANDRYEAEINWFPVTGEMEEVVNVCIKHSMPIPVDKLSSINRYNAFRFNLKICSQDDIQKMATIIISLDQEVNSLEPQSIRALINESRTQAGFPLMQEDDITIRDELDFLETEVQNEIFNKESFLSESEFDQLISLLADYFYKNERSIANSIINEICSVYQKSHETKLKTCEEDIENELTKFNQIEPRDANKELDTLFALVDRWMQYAFPLEAIVRTHKQTSTRYNDMLERLLDFPQKQSTVSDNIDFVIEYFSKIKTHCKPSDDLIDALTQVELTLTEHKRQINKNTNINRVMSAVKNNYEKIVMNPDAYQSILETSISDALQYAKTLSVDEKKSIEEFTSVFVIKAATELVQKGKTINATAIVRRLIAEVGDSSTHRQMLEEFISKAEKQTPPSSHHSNQQGKPASKFVSNTEKPKKSSRKFLIFILILVLAAFFLATPNGQNVISGILSTPTPVPTRTPAPTKTPRPTAAPLRMAVSNGKILVNTDYKCVCPLTVKTSAGSDYYVYLKYLREPTNTKESRIRKNNVKPPYESDIAFYITGGQTVSIEVPIGTYSFFYATGNTFYNTDILFGDNTSHFKSSETLDFYADSQYYQGHTITLYKVVDGNFDTKEIKESDFPRK